MKTIREVFAFNLKHLLGNESIKLASAESKVPYRTLQRLLDGKQLPQQDNLSLLVSYFDTEEPIFYLDPDRIDAPTAALLEKLGEQQRELRRLRLEAEERDKKLARAQADIKDLEKMLGFDWLNEPDEEQQAPIMKAAEPAEIPGTPEERAERLAHYLRVVAPKSPLLMRFMTKVLPPLYEAVIALEQKKAAKKDSNKA